MRSNFVLWSDGLDYYVSKRVGRKSDSDDREHFVAFFQTEAQAWAVAEAKTKYRIKILQSYIRHYRQKRGSK